MTATPRSGAETSELVRESAARADRIAIRGGSTHSRAFEKTSATRVIVTTGLDRIVDYQPENLVLEVETGIRFAALQRFLAEHGQRLPLDPLSIVPEERSTLGGVLSTNRFGPRRLRFGTARDWVIGSWLVRSDGAEVRAGGKVVKNVSGYDLSKLYIGARGRFGVLTRVALKLDPLPPAQAWIQATFSDFHAVQEGLRALEQARLGVSGAIAFQTSLAVVLEGWKELVPRDTQRALETIGGAGGTVVGVSEQMPDVMMGTARWKRTVRLATKRSQWSSLAVDARTLFDERAEHRLLGHPSSGTLWVSWNDAIAGTIDLSRLAQAHDANLMVERWPDDESAPTSPAADPQQTRLEEALKFALDPHNLFVTEPW